MPTDIFTGAILGLYSHVKMTVDEMDASSMQFCEDHCEEFPLFNAYAICAKLLDNTLAARVDLRRAFVKTAMALQQQQGSQAQTQTGSHVSPFPHTSSIASHQSSTSVATGTSSSSASTSAHSALVGTLPNQVLLDLLDRLGVSRNLNQQEKITLVRKFSDGQGNVYVCDVVDTLSRLFDEQKTSPRGGAAGHGYGPETDDSTSSGRRESARGRADRLVIDHRQQQQPLQEGQALCAALKQRKTLWRRLFRKADVEESGFLSMTQMQSILTHHKETLAPHLISFIVTNFGARATLATLSHMGVTEAASAAVAAGIPGVRSAVDSPSFVTNITAGSVSGPLVPPLGLSELSSTQPLAAGMVYASGQLSPRSRQRLLSKRAAAAIGAISSGGAGGGGAVLLRCFLSCFLITCISDRIPKWHASFLFVSVDVVFYSE